MYIPLPVAQAQTFEEMTRALCDPDVIRQGARVTVGGPLTSKAFLTACLIHRFPQDVMRWHDCPELRDVSGTIYEAAARGSELPNGELFLHILAEWQERDVALLRARGSRAQSALRTLDRRRAREVRQMVSRLPQSSAGQSLSSSESSEPSPEESDSEELLSHSLSGSESDPRQDSLRDE